MGLAELHLESLGTAKENLKARGRVANVEELGQIVGELHEEVKSNNELKEAPWAGTGCPVRGLAELVSCHSVQPRGLWKQEEEM